MLHHVSFSVRDPERAASVAAELLAARAVRAPSPPFPVGSWFVVKGDEMGSLIELTPWGSVLDPARPGITSDPHMRPHSASHVLASTPLATAEILAVADREALRAQAVSAGLFRFVKIWIEDSLLLELLPPENIRDYVECFGVAGTSSLDGRLRSLERDVAMSIGKP
jgi:catechol 2,3-dioxygenase-like lactoylglutathione lyase family enzyme